MNCPHCEWPFNYDEVYRWYADQEYDPDFEHDCTQCMQTIAVHAVDIPEFELIDPNKAPEPT